MKKQIEINFDSGIVVAGASLLVSAVSIIFAGKASSKLNRFSKKIGMTLEDLSNKTSVEITEEMVNRCTETAVQKAADKAANSVIATIRSDADAVISSKVQDAIQNQYDNVKDDVTRELRKQVSRINVSSLKAEIKDSVKREVTDRLHNEMNDILDSYNSQLTDIGKIYSSIADSMSKK